MINVLSVRSRLVQSGPKLARYVSGSPLNRPSPPPLPLDQQREFEELVRKAQTPLSPSLSVDQSEARLSMHPDAREPVQPDFQGDTNPVTGEKGGPRREPVKKWGNEGDWSHAGRVTDF
jgi:Protein of unknown function (DUF1674)